MSPQGAFRWLALLVLLPLAAAAEPPQRVVVDDLGRLPAFSHATVVGDLIFVSGTLGTQPGGLKLVPGGVGAGSEVDLIIFL